MIYELWKSLIYYLPSIVSPSTARHTIIIKFMNLRHFAYLRAYVNHSFLHTCRFCSDEDLFASGGGRGSLYLAARLMNNLRTFPQMWQGGPTFVPLLGSFQSGVGEWPWIKASTAGLSRPPWPGPACISGLSFRNHTFCWSLETHLPEKTPTGVFLLLPPPPPSLPSALEKNVIFCLIFGTPNSKNLCVFF